MATSTSTTLCGSIYSAVKITQAATLTPTCKNIKFLIDFVNRLENSLSLLIYCLINSFMAITLTQAKTAANRCRADKIPPASCACARRNSDRINPVPRLSLQDCTIRVPSIGHAPALAHNAASRQYPLLLCPSSTQDVRVWPRCAHDMPRLRPSQVFACRELASKSSRAAR